MKRIDLIFTALRLPVDLIAMIGAGLLAYVIRVQALQDFRPIVYDIPFSTYLEYVAGCSLLCILIFTITGLYTINFRRLTKEVSLVISACSTGIMGVIVLIFLVRELLTSRFVVLAAWLLSIILVSLGRIILHTVRSWILRSGTNAQQVVVIGSERNAQRVVEEIKMQRSHGYRVTGQFATFSPETRAKLDTLLAAKQLDEVIFMNSDVSRADFQAIMDYADVSHITLRYAADIIGDKNLEIATLGGIPLVEIKRTNLEGWGRIVKRAFDLFTGTILAIICLPLMALIIIAIRLESPGPAIYKNQRVGQKKLFNTYKFRSMFIQYCTGPGYDTTGEANKLEDQLVTEKSERTGPVFKIINDPRRTKVGRFLEKTSLDELPQLFNVIRGTMSLVGPRPHMPKEVAGYATHHHQLFSVKPGVTGLAQISGRSDLDFDDEAKLDIFYLENWSPWRDLVILLKTPLAVLGRKSRV